MKRNSALLTLGTLAVTFGWGTVARADDDIALSFALEPQVQEDDKAEAAKVAPKAIATSPPPEPVVSEDAPLPIPPGAESPPMSGDTAWPAGVYGGVDALAVGAAQSVQELLPAPPPASTPVQVAVAPTPEAPPAPAEPQAAPLPTKETTPEEPIDNLLALSLTLEPRPQREETSKSDLESTPAPQAQPAIAVGTWNTIQAIFKGGTDSLVARAVGSAEGTRTPEGHKNPAYFGHVDPGNGVWNMGTFSYQHGARTPEEADEKQLRRLQRQTEMLKRKAQEKGLDLSQEELLNGIDLANQAPLAALDRGGYIDWLQEAHKLGMTGSEAIVWARTRSFIDPDTQRWNAPGLGNNVYSISHDQERRANAIARAISFSAPTLVAQAPAPTEQLTAPQAPAPPTEVQPMIKTDDLAFSLQDAFDPKPNSTDTEPAEDSLLAAAPTSSEASTPLASEIELEPPTESEPPIESESQTQAQNTQASQPDSALVASVRVPLASRITNFFRFKNSEAPSPSIAETEVPAAITDLPENQEEAEMVTSQPSVDSPASEDQLDEVATVYPLETAEAEANQTGQTEPEDNEFEDPLAADHDAEPLAPPPREESSETVATSEVAPLTNLSAAAIAFPEDGSAGQPVSFASLDDEPLNKTSEVFVPEETEDSHVEATPEEATFPEESDDAYIEELLSEENPDADAAPVSLDVPSVQPEVEGRITDSRSPESVDAIANDLDADPLESLKKSASAVKEDAKAGTDKIIEGLNNFQTLLRREK